MSSWVEELFDAVANEFLLRDRSFTDEQLKILYSLSAQGMAQSGRAAWLLSQALDKEVAERAHLIFENFNQHLAAQSSINCDDLNGLCAQVKKSMLENFEELYNKTRIGEYIAQFNLTMLRKDCEINRDAVIKRVISQIKVAGGIAMKKQEETAASRSTVNINGDGNVVVAGSHGTRVALQFSKSTAEDLSEAFDALKAAIEKIDVDQDHKRDLIEVVGDCQAEVAQAKPNETRLKGMLFGLATAIQALGSLQPAWIVFKSAAALAGITVP